MIVTNKAQALVFLKDSLAMDQGKFLGVFSAWNWF